jgi:hypothetical protein
MATKLQIGETVYVPSSRVRGLRDYGAALYETRVVEVAPAKARIRLRDGAASEWIGAGLISRGVGILVVNVGDFETEDSLLDPLAKSMTQFFRLLVPDDQVRHVRVRSLAELGRWWTINQGAYSHVVWIGHGSRTAVKFGVDGWIEADQLVATLRVPGTFPKTYVSLGCRTGYRSFGATISRSAGCASFIAPFNDVPGAIASQFCQTFFANHWIEGRTVGVAFRDARRSVPGSTSFRLWRNGFLRTVPQ